VKWVYLIAYQVGKKGKDMNKYIVNARETVFYTVEVEAENQEQLESMISSGMIDFGNAFDGDNFMIDAIEEVKNAN